MLWRVAGSSGRIMRDSHTLGHVRGGMSPSRPRRHTEGLGRADRAAYPDRRGGGRLPEAARASRIRRGRDARARRAAGLPGDVPAARKAPQPGHAAEAPARRGVCGRGPRPGRARRLRHAPDQYPEDAGERRGTPSPYTAMKGRKRAIKRHGGGGAAYPNRKSAATARRALAGAFAPCRPRVRVVRARRHGGLVRGFAPARGIVRHRLCTRFGSARIVI